MPDTAVTSHRWRFFRAGGADQLALERGDDLRHLGALDRKLWVALACPVAGLELDERTLALMDADGDGRLRQPEIVAAVQWAVSMVKDPATLLAGGELALASIADGTDEGRHLLAAARSVLAALGRPSATTIGVADASDAATAFAALPLNGDGVVPIEAFGDAHKSDVEAIIGAVGAATDLSGAPGISQETLDAFVAEADAFLAWWDQGQAAGIRPLGDATAAGVAAFEAVKPKIDDYFARTRVAAFDARALEAVNRQEAEYLAIAAGDLSITAAELSGFPLARVEPDRPLPLEQGLNPAWADAIGAFRAQVVTPLLGAATTTLTAAQWATITATVGPYQAWHAAKAGAKVEALGADRVRTLRDGPSRAAIAAKIAEDAAKAPEREAIAAVERLVRYQRDLVVLLNNFVAFRDFYSRERPAVFQAGTLVLDGRSCTLCIRVADAGAHAGLGGLAKTYLAYCQCTRPGEAPMTIAAAFTDGDADNLMVGRNGVFWDRQGRDWDATITKIVENPISIRQAFWAPYKKLVRLIEEQVAKRAAAGESAADAKLASAAEKTATADAAAKAEPKKIDVGTVAALGVAFGALATAFAAIAGYIGGVLKLPFWQIVLAVAGLLLLVSTPSMVIAWLKLRQRNLGPILDANGWAVNAPVKMNVPFGSSLTTVATLPDGAQSSMAVRYPEPPSALPRLVLLLVAIAFVLSLLAQFKLLPALR
ncbi:MAG: hypothetical protein MUF53_04155 [Gemmatimonadaceae bacterium]|nr:hypothetical protein [Gemmatimonadaceae bacterium]